MHTNHFNPQRDLVANALVLLLKNIDPKLDPTHFAKHTPLKAEMKNGHDAATFIKDCSHVCCYLFVQVVRLRCPCDRIPTMQSTLT